jgi:hypothetical protein
MIEPAAAYLFTIAITGFVIGMTLYLVDPKRNL